MSRYSPTVYQVVSQEGWKRMRYLPFYICGATLCWPFTENTLALVAVMEDTLASCKPLYAARFWAAGLIRCLSLSYGVSLPGRVGSGGLQRGSEYPALYCLAGAHSERGNL